MSILDFNLLQTYMRVYPRLKREVVIFDTVTFLNLKGPLSEFFVFLLFLALKAITVIIETGTIKIVKLDVSEVNYAFRPCST